MTWWVTFTVGCLLASSVWSQEIPENGISGATRAAKRALPRWQRAAPCSLDSGGPDGPRVPTASFYYFTGLASQPVAMLALDGPRGESVLYLEDMILMTETGHEVLSRGLPYPADEIARDMAGR